MLKDMQWCRWGQNDPAAFSTLSRDHSNCELWECKDWNRESQTSANWSNTQSHERGCFLSCLILQSDPLNWLSLRYYGKNLTTFLINDLSNDITMPKCGVMIWAFRINRYYEKNCCNVCPLSNPWTAEICNFIIFNIQLQYQLCQF